MQRNAKMYERSNMYRFLSVFMDVVLAMGCKSNRPAFMTMWMVVVACSIFFLFCLWILLFVGIYLRQIYIATNICMRANGNFFYSETNPDGWSPLVKTPSQIASYRLFMGSAVVGMFLLFVMPCEYTTLDLIRLILGFLF